MGNYRTEAIGYYKLVKKLRRYHAGQLQYFGHAHLSGTTSRNPGLSPVWKKSCIAKLRMVGFRAVVGKVKPKARNQIQSNYSRQFLGRQGMATTRSLIVGQENLDPRASSFWTQRAKTNNESIHRIHHRSPSSPLLFMLLRNSRFYAFFFFPTHLLPMQIPNRNRGSFSYL